MANCTRVGCSLRIVSAVCSVVMARTPGRQSGAVEAEIDLGQPRRGGEAQLVRGVVVAERADVGEAARFQAEQVAAVDQFGIRRVLADLGDHRLVQARAASGRSCPCSWRIRRAPWSRPCRRRRCRDGRCSGASCRRWSGRWRRSRSSLVIQIGDPAERLLRRGDVVAPGAEHDDRRADVAQVDARAVGGAQLAGGELVADEQVVGDPLHLLGVEQHRAAPPGLEFQEALRLGVDLGIDVVGLLPVACWRGSSIRSCATRSAPSKMPWPRSPASAVSQVPPSTPPR